MNIRNTFEVGKIIGYWTILNFDKTVVNNNRKRHFWLCRCSCGTIKSVNEDNLKLNKSLSCGCYQKRLVSELSYIDLTGEKFGRLTVLSRANDRVTSKGNTYVIFNCKCDCGNKTKVSSRNLISGNTKSCGCLHLEILRNRIGSKAPNFKHGKSKDGSYRRRPKWWSNYIRNRDKVCIACQDIPEIGHAHHLDGWSEFKDKREDTLNGVLLCSKCHYEFHNMYGKYTTKQQFIEWIYIYYLDSYLALLEKYGYEEGTISVFDKIGEND